VLVAAVSVAGVLAMVATWLLVAYYPIPDDETVYLGLLGFFFVMFLMSPLYIIELVPKFDKGRA
jgi:hypothetical protein